MVVVVDDADDADDGVAGEGFGRGGRCCRLPRASVTLVMIIMGVLMLVVLLALCWSGRFSGLHVRYHDVRKLHDRVVAKEERRRRTDALARLEAHLHQDSLSVAARGPPSSSTVVKSTPTTRYVSAADSHNSDASWGEQRPQPPRRMAQEKVHLPPDDRSTQRRERPITAAMFATLKPCGASERGSEAIFAAQVASVRAWLEVGRALRGEPVSLLEDNSHAAASIITPSPLRDGSVSSVILSTRPPPDPYQQPFQPSVRSRPPHRVRLFLFDTEEVNVNGNHTSCSQRVAQALIGTAASSLEIVSAAPGGTLASESGTLRLGSAAARAESWVLSQWRRGGAPPAQHSPIEGDHDDDHCGVVGYFNADIIVVPADAAVTLAGLCRQLTSFFAVGRRQSVDLRDPRRRQRATSAATGAIMAEARKRSAVDGSATDTAADRRSSGRRQNNPFSVSLQFSDYFAESVQTAAASQSGDGGGRLILDRKDAEDVFWWTAGYFDATMIALRRSAAMSHAVTVTSPPQRLPEFHLGRPAFDNWLVHTAVHSGQPVVDFTSAVTLLHQLHDYNHLPGGPSSSDRRTPNEVEKRGGDGGGGGGDAAAAADANNKKKTYWNTLEQKENYELAESLGGWRHGLIEFAPLVATIVATTGPQKGRGGVPLRADAAASSSDSSPTRRGEAFGKLADDPFIVQSALVVDRRDGSSRTEGPSARTTRFSLRWSPTWKGLEVDEPELGWQFLTSREAYQKHLASSFLSP